MRIPLDELTYAELLVGRGIRHKGSPRRETVSSHADLLELRKDLGTLLSDLKREATIRGIEGTYCTNPVLALVEVSYLGHSTPDDGWFVDTYAEEPFYTSCVIHGLYDADTSKWSIFRNETDVFPPVREGWSTAKELEIDEGYGDRHLHTRLIWLEESPESYPDGALAGLDLMNGDTEHFRWWRTVRALVRDIVSFDLFGAVDVRDLRWTRHTGIRVEQVDNIVTWIVQNSIQPLRVTIGSDSILTATTRGPKVWMVDNKVRQLKPL